MKIVLKQWAKSPKSCAAYIASALITIIYTAVNTWIVTLISNAMNHPENMHRNIATVLVVCCFQMVIGPLSSYLRKFATQWAFSAMSNDWFTKIIDVDFEMFTRYSCSKVYTVGEFLWRCTAAAQSVFQLINCCITVIVTLVAMYMIGGTVIIPVIVVYAIGMLIFRWLFTVYNKIDKELASVLKKRNQEHENIINGFAEVRCFGTQDFHRERIIRFNNEIRDGKLKRVQINSFTNFSFEMIDTIGLAVVMIYAVGSITHGTMAAATGMSLVLYVFRIINPLAGILDFIDGMSESLSLADDFDKISSYVNRVSVVSENPIDISSFDDKIEIKNASFAYGDSSTVLKNISMTIPKRKKVALVGESGKGKSTLAKLLLHFYNPTEGSITIDGIDLKDVTDSSFRRLTGSIQQENNIFPGTIWDNVIYGSPEALEAEVIDACKRARIYDFIIGLPKKFETEVGPRGLKLSGGQKQRIALARLFLKNPEIIILDEATSALDNETETMIQEAIGEMSDKTIITIAHRLSTIRDCDVIYVIGNQGIVESGTHEELVAKGGAYAAMLK